MVPEKDNAIGQFQFGQTVYRNSNKNDNGVVCLVRPSGTVMVSFRHALKECNPQDLKIIPYFITFPAIRVKNTGEIHDKFYDHERAEECYADSHGQLIYSRGLGDSDVECGFMTNTGEFVNREQAATIAFNAGQTDSNNGRLQS